MAAIYITAGMFASAAPQMSHVRFSRAVPPPAAAVNISHLWELGRRAQRPVAVTCRVFLFSAFSFQSLDQGQERVSGDVRLV